MEIKKKSKEPTSFLLRRFSQQVRESGILVEVKKSQYHRKEQSKGQRRKSALEREGKRKARLKLKKLGRI